MKKRSFQGFLFAAVLLFGLSTAVSLHAQGKPGWLDNQPKALEQAKAGKKLVLMDFTGSDWCSWCQKMDKEVFSDPAFKQYAQDHLVLLELDFPQQKPLDPAIRKQNEDLAKQYGVEGFPTLLVLDSDGKPIKAFQGYQEGGAKAFIEQLKQLKG